MAGILSIVPSPGHPADDFHIRRGLRVQILDRNWAAERVFPLRGELSDGFVGVQSGVPHRGASAAPNKGWL